ncbi:MAG: thioesterase family protein [Pseudomonadota bacterium]|jgi:acyl-CoA thioester hydrolase|uniref:thioesterase family protein n=1 Tax=Alcanivorax sp. TaxID=1872427 RepID=UPI00243842C5|nr:thioesterase family protein [Alcanivorax sp.]MED5238296.1 thioesterase family protein [Pseudomonadota bacterium]MEE3320142.1 thioesterase family protein [Pseudomonadota bacterium]
MRVNIQFPDNPIFHYSMVISKDHENIAGHLAHDKVVTIIGDCRDAWFASLGFPGCVVDGISIVNSDLMLMYIAEAFHGDELNLELAMADINKYGGDMLLRATRQQDGSEVFRAKSGFVFFDYSTRKVTPRPKGFDASLGLDDTE